jgi:hypothetical protein
MPAAAEECVGGRASGRALLEPTDQRVALVHDLVFVLEDLLPLPALPALEFARLLAAQREAAAPPAQVHDDRETGRGARATRAVLDATGDPRTTARRAIGGPSFFSAGARRSLRRRPSAVLQNALSSDRRQELAAPMVSMSHVARA